MTPSRTRQVATAALVLGSVLVPGACSDSTGPVSREHAAEYLTSLPSWETFSPSAADADEIVGSGSARFDLVGDTRYECTTTPYSITRTPDKIVTLDPDVNILWLGALLQGKGYKGGIGSMKEWGVRERAPLRVSIDILGADNYRVVNDPDLASVNQAIGSMVQEAFAGGHRGGSSASYSMERTYNSRQAGLSLGLSTMYFGPRVSASFAIGRNASEKTVTAYFVQRMFTASVVLPSSPEQMFGGAFTPARLEEEVARGNVGSDNLPVYVASIVYGRSLLFSFTSSTTIDSIRAALSVSVAKDSLGGALNLKRILSEGRISVVALGGEGRNAAALIQSGNLEDYFSEEAALTSARPISYTIRNLGDNSIAKVTETTQYELEECTAIPTTGRARIDVTPNDASVSVIGPSGYTFGPQTGDQLLTELTPGGYSVMATRQGYDTLRTEISVAAGDEIDVPMTLRASNQTVTGSIVELTPLRLIINDVSCTGESQPDVHHTISVNGKPLTNRTSDNYVSLYAGEQDNPGRANGNWRTVVDTVWFSGSRSTMVFDAVVWDLDGALSAPERMSLERRTWTATQIPIGTNLGMNLSGGGSSCRTRFEWSAVRRADIFTPPPT